MSTAKRVAKNTGILYARMAITVFISLYATRLILNSLGVEDYGIFGVVAGAIAMLTFLNNAMTGATQRFISYAQGAGDLEKVKTIFNVSVVMHLIIAALVLIILEVAGYFLFDSVLKIPPGRMGAAQTVYQFMVVSCLFTIISVPYDAVINAHENMLLVAILGIIEALLKLGAAIYLTYTSFDKLKTFGFLSALIVVIILLLRRLYCNSKYEECKIAVKKYWNRGVFREMTSFGGWNFLGASSSMVGFYGQGIMLNSFFGATVNAAQSVALQVGGQLSVFGNTMLKALNPVIAKSEGLGDRAAMLRATLMGTKYSFLLMIVFFTPAIIEMPYLLKIWLKQVPDYAVIFCRLYLVKNLVDQLYVTFNASIAAVGNIKKQQVVTSILNTVPLLVCGVLFFLGGDASWLYIVYMLSSVSIFGVNLSLMKSKCGMSMEDYFKQVFTPCVIITLSSFALGLLGYMFLEDGFLRLIVVVVCSTIGYLVSCWFFALESGVKQRISQGAQSLKVRLRVAERGS